jgi:hypothetical protein
MNYFRLTEAPTVLRELDKWIRRRVRVCVLKAWKRPRTRARKLRAFGLEEWRVTLVASCSRGVWFTAGMALLASALSARWLNEQGLVSLYDRWLQLRTTS